MPKRKAPAGLEKKTKKVARKRSKGKGKQSGVSAADAFFEAYYDAESGEIKAAGTMELLKDLELDPSDVATLVLAWRAGCERMGYFSRAEFTALTTALKVSTVAELKAKLPELRLVASDAQEMKGLSAFAFKYLLSAEANSEFSRQVSVESGLQMLAILLGGTWARWSDFELFAQESGVRSFNRDQWTNISAFAAHVKPDLSNFDVDGAWPVLLDEFVEWYTERAQA